VNRSRWFSFALIASLAGWFFAEAIFGGGQFAVRDAGHYYAPLFRYCRQQWGEGRVPLWNPLEGLGVPLAADPSVSVFYPGKLVFALPIGFDAAYKIYLIGHIALAAWATYFAARRFGHSVEAATIAAMAYAFSGVVLFQCANAVYLVGAAWLPLALAAAERTLAARSFRAAVGLGVVLAMMILGGDPQTAYHAGLLAAFYAFWRSRNERKAGTLRIANAAESNGNLPDPLERGRTVSPPPPNDALASNAAQRAAICAAERRPFASRFVGFLRGRIALLTLAASTAGLLAAAQILPSMAFVQRTERADVGAARSLYEIPAARAAGQTWPQCVDSLTCRQIDADAHHANVYRFSVGPWRLTEYLWPNVGGRQFPVYRRWFDAIPAEGLVWTPSLYMGLLPLLLAWSAMRWRRAAPRTLWLSWSVALAVAASFGGYGLGWIAQEIRAACGGDPSSLGLMGRPCGGLYWLFTIALPGYIQFRYPAKWLVVAALGLGMLAADGWDRVVPSPSPRFRRRLCWLAGASALGVMVAVALRPLMTEWLRHAAGSAVYGPLDCAGANNDLLAAMLLTTIEALYFAWLLRPDCDRPRWTSPIALVVVALDLALANGWMIACAPEKENGRPAALAASIQQAEAKSPDGAPYRVYRRPTWFPESWSLTQSTQRVAESALWERDTLRPKYNLDSGLPLVAEGEGMQPRDAQALFRSDIDPRRLVDWVGAKYLVLRSIAQFEGGSRLAGPTADGDWPEDVSLWRNPKAFGRAWIVHEIEVLPPLETATREAIAMRTAEVFQPGGKPRDLRRTAVIEGGNDLLPKRDLGHGEKETPSPSLSSESCRVVRHEPTLVEIEATLRTPGLVVLADQFDPDWRLDATSGGEPKPQPILRTNRVMRGVWLSAGVHRLVYRYRPGTFYCGSILSGGAWAALAAGFVATTIRRKRKPRIERAKRQRSAAKS
jgi:hypothetical protein